MKPLIVGVFVVVPGLFSVKITFAHWPTAGICCCGMFLFERFEIGIGYSGKGWKIEEVADCALVRLK